MVIINSTLAFQITPFVRVGREKTTTRAVNYKTNKAALATELAMLSGPARDLFPFETWHLRITIDRPSRTGAAFYINDARTLWRSMGEITGSIWQGIVSRLGKNGDADNLLKTVLDAGNGILWFDDELVSSAAVIVRRSARSHRLHILAIAEIS